MSSSKYRSDDNLSFLSKVQGKKLKILANILIEDIDGNEQWTGSLKADLAKQIGQYRGDDLYEKNWDLIAAELQLYGGNTFTNLARGKGVLYSEILEDVCGRVGLKIQSSDSISKNEEKLLLTLFQKDVGVEDIDFMLKSLTKQGYLGWTSAKSSTANFLKRDLGLGTAGVSKRRLFENAVKLAARANPVVLAWDMSGAAYRITIPAVCIVAVLRKDYLKQ